VLSGFSNYLWPLLLGSRDMAFPRLNALSYWVYLFAGIFSIAASCWQGARQWLVQLCAVCVTHLQPGPNIDVYALGMVLYGISTTVGSITLS